MNLSPFVTVCHFILDYCEIVEMLEVSVTTKFDLRSLQVELKAEIDEVLGLGEAPR